MSEQINEDYMEIDQEQLQELMSGSDKLPPIEIPMEWYDMDAFMKGIAETSYISGVITALLNTGLTESAVLDYLLNKETIKHNIRTAEINKEMNVEIAKNQRIVAEKNEL